MSERPMTVRERRERGQVGDGHQRIGERLDVEYRRARRALECGFDRFRVARIDGNHRISTFLVIVLKKRDRAAVQPLSTQQRATSWHSNSERAVDRGHPARGTHGGCAFFISAIADSKWSAFGPPYRP